MNSSFRRAIALLSVVMLIGMAAAAAFSSLQRQPQTTLPEEAVDGDPVLPLSETADTGKVQATHQQLLEQLQQAAEEHELTTHLDPQLDSDETRRNQEVCGADGSHLGYVLTSSHDVSSGKFDTAVAVLEDLDLQVDRSQPAPNRSVVLGRTQDGLATAAVTHYNNAQRSTSLVLTVATTLIDEPVGGYPTNDVLGSC